MVYPKALLEPRCKRENRTSLDEKHDSAGTQKRQLALWPATKTLESEFRELPLETARDRNASLEPKIIGKGQTRLTTKSFDVRAGMSTRQTQGILKRYEAEASPALIADARRAGRNRQITCE